MFKKILYLFVLLIPQIAFSDVCIDYKINPHVHIFTPKYTKTVVQSDIQVDKLHGNVLATLVEDYDLVVDIMPVSGGFCVILKNIDGTIGYNDFSVKVDQSHIIGTCSYNAILHHEDKHISAYLSVISDLNNDIKNSVFNAANSIMPVFINSRDDVDSVIENMNYEMQQHPDLILMKRKINTAQEIRNKRVDQGETGTELTQCFY